MEDKDGEAPPAIGARDLPGEPTVAEALAAWETAFVMSAAVVLAALRAAWRRTRTELDVARATLVAAWLKGRVALSVMLVAAVMLATSGSAQGAAHSASDLSTQGVASPAMAGDASSDTSFSLSRGQVISRAASAPSGARSSYASAFAPGQGCPNGKAPKPGAWLVGSAGDYGAPSHNTVALTFDDGPTPYSSPAILSVLERTHTPATFFVLGEYAKYYPWLIQREAADGFTIGIHTWNHPDMRLLTPTQRAWQLTAAIQQLRADLGPGFCVWLWRPPYGSINTSIMRQAGSFGLTTIFWNVDPADWSRPGTMEIVRRVLAQVRPGSIILMHDGPVGREQTAAALPYILAGLRARGLTPVSLPQLLQGYPPPTANPAAQFAPTGQAGANTGAMDAARY